MISDVEHVAFADAGRGFISFSARGGPWFRQHQSRNVTEAGFCQVPVVLLPAGLHVLCFWKPSSNHWLKGIRMDSLFCLGRNMCDEISSGLQTLLATPSNPCSPAAGEDPVAFSEKPTVSPTDRWAKEDVPRWPHRYLCK